MYVYICMCVWVHILKQHHPQNQHRPRQTEACNTNDVPLEITNSFGGRYGFFQTTTMWAPKIAKLVYNSNNYGLWYL